MNPHITASRDLGYFNRMMNHPEIFPSIHDDSSDSALDISSLNKKANVFLKIECEGREAGFAFFVAKGVFCYEMHSGLLEEFRGAFAIRAGHGVIDWMMTNTDAEVISTFCWSNAKPAMWAARQIGFREVSRAAYKHKVNGEPVDLAAYTIDLMEWARESQYRFDGIAFNIIKDFSASSSMQPFAGMAALIALSGNYSKAQMFYNKWALIFGCPPIQFNGTRARGVVFSVGNSVVELSQNLSTSVVEEVA